MGKTVKRVQRRVYRAILEALEFDAPDLYAELQDLRKYNPQQYRKEIRLLVASGYEGGAFDEYEPLFIKEGERDEYRASRDAAKEQLYATQASEAVANVTKKKPAKKKPAKKKAAAKK